MSLSCTRVVQRMDPTSFWLLLHHEDIDHQRPLAHLSHALARNFTPAFQQFLIRQIDVPNMDRQTIQNP